MAPPVGLRRLGNVAAIGVAVPAKDCPWSRHSDGSYRGGPKREILPIAIGGEKITADFRKILGHIVKHGGLGKPDPRLSAECAYNTYKADSRELVDSILGGSVLKYVGHRACVRKASQLARLSKRIAELSKLFKRQEQAGGQEKNASIGQWGMENGLVLCRIALMARSCLGRKSGIIFASDMS